MEFFWFLFDVDVISNVLYSTMRFGNSGETAQKTPVEANLPNKVLWNYATSQQYTYYSDEIVLNK